MIWSDAAAWGATFSAALVGLGYTLGEIYDRKNRAHARWVQPRKTPGGAPPVAAAPNAVTPDGPEPTDSPEPADRPEPADSPESAAPSMFATLALLGPSLLIAALPGVLYPRALPRGNLPFLAFSLLLWGVLGTLAFRLLP